MSNNWLEIVIEEILKEIQDKYKISNRKIMEKSELDEKQISKFRNGKINLNTSQLSALISALEEINPQARIDLGLRIGGCYSDKEEIDWEKIINNVSKKDVRQILNAIGKLIDPLEE